MTQRELKMNTRCTKLTRKGIWCQCDSLWHRDYVHVSQIMIMWQIIPLICSWVNDRRSVISNSKKSFKNNPLLDSLENGGLMRTRALVPSLFDVPFLWCSISKKIEMTWTRKFRFHNFGWSLPDHVYWSGILVLKKRSKLFELGASRSIPLAVLRRKSFLEKSSKTILEHDELIEPTWKDGPVKLDGPKWG